MSTNEPAAHQAAVAIGNGISIVQIVGDGNRVELGHPHLTLTRYWARRQVRRDLDRLSPYTRSTSLLGRESELASLRAFLDDPRPIIARVLIGGGGSGKTRLGLELCEQVAATGWDTGFVAGGELQRFFDAQNLSAWGWRKPTLIVVDYAAQHAQLLRQWFDELADRPRNPPQHRLRLLLLERSASLETGWWTTVFASGGWGAVSKRALLDPPEPVELLPLARADDRFALLRDMVAQASPGTSLDTLRQDGPLRDKLMQLSWGGDPLFLMMAALHMAQVGHAKALTLGRTDLADALASREGNRLQQLARAQSLSPDLMLHLAACVTLAQGMTRLDFEQFAASEKVAVGRPSGGDVASLADLLQEALPRKNGIAPVLPDLIGEALIVGTLRQDTGQAAVLRCYTQFGPPVAQSVIRCAQDFAQGNKSPLQWLQGIVQKHWEDRPALAALDASLPVDSVVLRDVNLQVARRIHELLASGEGGAPETRAAALNGLAVALAKIGQREPALQAAQEAVDLYRELATERPDVFRPNLAMSLIVLALRTRDSGTAVDALPLAREAVEVLSPEFLRYPQAHGDLMRAMRDEYIQWCESVGVDPDRDLLDPLQPFFTDLE